MDEGSEGTGVNERSEAGHRSPLDKDGSEKNKRIPGEAKGGEMNEHRWGRVVHRNV